MGAVEKSGKKLKQPSRKGTRMQGYAGYHQGLHGEMGDVDDLDEHTAGQVAITLLGVELNDRVQATHTAIQRKNSPDDRSPEADSIRKYLLNSPPDTPDSPPLSGGFRDAQAVQLEDQLYHDLIKADKEAHRQMNDLQGISEWWTANKQTWRENRKLFKSLIANIDTFKQWREADEQENGRNKSSGIGESIHTPNIEEAEREAEEIYIWFLNNRRIMRCVWGRVKQLREQTEQTKVRSISRKPVPPSPTVGSHRLFDITDNVATLSWYPGIGLIGWVERALIDKRTKEQRLHVEVLKLETQSEACQASVNQFQQDLDHNRTRATSRQEEVDRRLRVLRKAGSHEELRRIVEIRSREQVRELATEEDIQDNLKAYAMKSREVDVDLRICSDQEKITQVIIKLLSILQKYVRQYGTYKESLLEDFAAKLVSICYVNHVRQVEGLALATIVDNCSATRKSKIYSLLEDHLQRNNIEYHPAFFGANEPDFMTVDEDLQPLRIVIDTELYEFKKLRQEAQKREREALAEDEDAEKYREALLKEEEVAKYVLPEAEPGGRLPSYQRPFEGVRLSYYWSEIHARELIDLVSGYRKRVPNTVMPGKLGDTWRLRLIHFFISPDIFSQFFNHGDLKRSWSRIDFFTKINKLTMDPIRTDILESFLTYCTRTQELFKVGQFTGRVETLDAGWDFAPEAEIRGPERKIDIARVSRPEGLSRAEHWLLQEKHKRLFNNSERLISRSDLLLAINADLHGTMQLTRQMWQGILSYWTLAGKFFVLLERYIFPTLLMLGTNLFHNSEGGKDFEDQNMLRVDNGWNFDPKSDALPLDSRPDSWNKILADVLEADFVKRELRDTRPPTISFKRLYRTIYCRDKDENWSNWDSTEYKFNLWMRHASENKYLFRYVTGIVGLSGKVGATLTSGVIVLIGSTL